MEQNVFEERMQLFLERRLKEEGTINAMMDMQLVSYDFETKHVILAFPIRKWQLNPAHNLHGGIISTAMDITMGCIAFTTSLASFTPTIHLDVNFNAAIKEGDVFLVEGICDHCGSRMAQTRAIAYVKDKTSIVATANGSYAINTHS